MFKGACVSSEPCSTGLRERRRLSSYLQSRWLLSAIRVRVYARLDELREETAQKLADVRRTRRWAGTRTVRSVIPSQPITRIAWLS